VLAGGICGRALHAKQQTDCPGLRGPANPQPFCPVLVMVDRRWWNVASFCWTVLSSSFLCVDPIHVHNKRSLADGGFLKLGVLAFPL
jgi:hypothetical protein